MSEAVRVPGVLGISSIIGDAVVDVLTANGKLPADFEFRLLGIGPQDRRREVATQDVLAALGYGEGSGEDYLQSDLPTCVLVAGVSKIRPILSKLDTDYHMLSDLATIAEELDLRRAFALQSWNMYIRHLNPQLHAYLQGIYTESTGRSEAGNSKRLQYATMLGRVVIKDKPLLDIHQGRDEVTGPGHGPVRQKLLHYLLLDNHPELGPGPA